MTAATPQPPAHSPMSPLRIRSRNARISGMIRIILTVLLITSVAAICAVTVCMSLLVGVSALIDPNNLHSLEQWTAAISSSAQTATELVVFIALLLVAGAVALAIAAWHRNRWWLTVCSISTVMLTLTLFLTASFGFSNVNSVIEHTQQRLGAVEVVPQDQESHIPPALTQADAEAEVSRLLHAITGATGAPLSALDPATQVDQVFSPDDPPLQYESCTPDPNQGIGTQISLSFSLPSDDEGALHLNAISTWTTAGYPPQDAMRSEYFFGDTSTPIHRASLNDRYTIDGKIHGHITTGCAITTPAPAPTSAPIPGL